MVLICVFNFAYFFKFRNDWLDERAVENRKAACRGGCKWYVHAHTCIITLLIWTPIAKMLIFPIWLCVDTENTKTMTFRYVLFVLVRCMCIFCAHFFCSVKGMMCERCAEKLKHSTYRLSVWSYSLCYTLIIRVLICLSKGVTSVELNFEAEKIVVVAKCDPNGIIYSSFLFWRC